MNINQTEQTKRHIHADLIIAWANGAVIEKYIAVISDWEICLNPGFYPECQYRIKPEAPKTIKIGEYYVPEPLRVAPERSSAYYFPSVTDLDMYNDAYWSNDSFDKGMLNRGILHLTKESAILHAKALISLSQSNSNANQG